MDKLKLYSKLLDELSSDLHLLVDKPDETPASTLGAMWLTAAGRPSSAREVHPDDLPDLLRIEQNKLLSYIKRRVAGKPLAHITGRQLFLDMEFITGAGALIPRKETELLAKAALDQIKRISDTNTAPLIIDACTGMGNLAISMAKHCTQITVAAGDLSVDAVELARKNVLFHHLEDRVEIFQGDLLTPFSAEHFHKKVDLITCNPPYISSAKVEKMDSEISLFEPRLAFDGGPFGIKILQRLLKDAPHYLNDYGCLMFEVGQGQGEALVRLVSKMKKYKNIIPIYDENKQIRAISAYV